MSSRSRKRARSRCRADENGVEEKQADESRSDGRRADEKQADENRADCPFTITKIATPTRDQSGLLAKKRRRDSADDESRELVQHSPFQPRGSFKTHQSMDLSYWVEPRKRWLDMTRYNSFVLNNSKYYNEDYVYIANDATIERQKAAGGKDADGDDFQTSDYWIAKILEVRALDEHHVYARIYWMYSPDELPRNTMDGKRLIRGRQPYHGQNELIASNHMDVINVVSIAMHAVVNQWVESDDEQVHDALYWRQAFDCRTSQLSSVDLTCKCQTPANPDKTLVGCTKPGCEEWLHFECLEHDVLMRVYSRLGTDRPHRPETSPSVKREMKDEATPPRSATSTSDRKGERTSSSMEQLRDDDNREPLSPSTKSVEEMAVRKIRETAAPAPSLSKSARSTLSRSSSSAKKKRLEKAPGKRPYDGLFKATLKLDEGPTVWEITDLRKGISGGDRTWTERALCLICDTAVD